MPEEEKSYRKWNIDPEKNKKNLRKSLKSYRNLRGLWRLK